jgi:hypothetical protein
LKVTVEALRNPVPVMVSVCAVAPAVSDAGDSEVTVGTGLLEGGVPPPLELPPPHAETNRNGTLRRTAYAKQRAFFAEFRHDRKVIVHSP